MLKHLRSIPCGGRLPRRRLHCRVQQPRVRLRFGRLLARADPCGARFGSNTSHHPWLLPGAQHPWSLLFSGRRARISRQRSTLRARRPRSAPGTRRWSIFALLAPTFLAHQSRGPRSSTTATALTCAVSAGRSCSFRLAALELQATPCTLVERNDGAYDELCSYNVTTAAGYDLVPVAFQMRLKPARLFIHDVRAVPYRAVHDVRSHSMA
jgi:hypothetical protein